MCGHYFEAMVYKRLCELSNSPFNTSDLGEQQIEAIRLFEEGRNGILTEQGAGINSAARDAGTQWVEWMEKEMGTKDFTVNMIADVELTNPYTGKTVMKGEGSDKKPVMIGNPVGDVQLIVNGRSIILELKWQESLTTQVHYFHGVSEETLFSGGFRKYLKANFETFWSHEYGEEDWKKQIGFTALSSYLLQEHKNWESVLTYLLGKGDSPQNKGIQQDGKFVIHGTSVSLTIMDINSLAREILNRTKQLGLKTWKGRSTLKGTGIGFYRGGEEVASFGIKSFYGLGLGEVFKTKTNDLRKSKQEERIDKAKFSYQMFIDQKVFNDAQIKRR